MKIMKGIVFSLLISISTFSVMAQNNYYPTTGSVLLGTPSYNLYTNAGPNNYNLQLHTQECGGNPAGKSVCGYLVKFAMTNQVTGINTAKGFEIRLIDKNVSVFNYAHGGNMSLGLNFGSKIIFSSNTKRIYFGQSYTNNDVVMGKFVFDAILDNGIFIKTNIAGKYGLSFQSAALTDNAIQVMGIDGQTRNFSVKANGQVYARKYTTTLNNIPDYVFLPNYKLMSFSDLRTFVTTNHHLPNVPSANDYQQNGVDLGEMNRVLLEKTEELTLYILQLEERIKKLEENNQQH